MVIYHNGYYLTFNKFGVLIGVFKNYFDAVRALAEG